MEQEESAPPVRPAGKTAREVRLEREAAALRANLRKRKEQARVREPGVVDDVKVEDA